MYTKFLVLSFHKYSRNEITKLPAVTSPDETKWEALAENGVAL